MSLTRSILDSVFSRLARGHARRQYRKFIRETAAAVQVQEQVLRAKLRINADSDFGRSHQFARIQSYDDFTAAVPVQSDGKAMTYAALAEDQSAIQTALDAKWGDHRAAFGAGLACEALGRYEKALRFYNRALAERDRLAYASARDRVKTYGGRAAAFESISTGVQ